MATQAPWVAAVQWCGTRGFFDSYHALPETQHPGGLTRAEACQRLFDEHFAQKDTPK
jgi:hypothetical protein